MFCSITDIQEFLSEIPTDVGLILDLGHLNVSSNIIGFDRNKFLDNYINVFSDRLQEIHVSENNGKYDEHLPIKENSWQLDYKEVKWNKWVSRDKIICLIRNN